MKPVFISLTVAFLLLVGVGLLLVNYYLDPFVDGERDYSEIVSLRDRFAANPSNRSPLNTIIKRTNSWSELTRANAVAVLGQLARDPKLRPEIADSILPVFVGVLRDSKQSVRRGGVEGLEALGPLASSTLPMLRALHTDGDWLIRQEADDAIRRIEEGHP